jgi:hypothetical protein
MAFKFTDVVFKIGTFSEEVGDRDVPFVYGKKKKTVKTVTFTYIDKAVLNALATRANEDDGSAVLVMVAFTRTPSFHGVLAWIPRVN